MITNILRPFVRQFNTKASNAIQVNLVSNTNKTKTLLFEVKDSKSMREIIHAVETKNYSVKLTPSGLGSASQLRYSNKDVFLL